MRANYWTTKRKNNMASVFQMIRRKQCKENVIGAIGYIHRQTITHGAQIVWLENQ